MFSGLLSPWWENVRKRALEKDFGLLTDGDKEMTKRSTTSWILEEREKERGYVADKEKWGEKDRKMEIEKDWGKSRLILNAVHELVSVGQWKGRI